MQEIGIPCHLYEGLCVLALSWVFLHVIHSGLLVHPLIDLDGSCSWAIEGCLRSFHWLVDLWSCQNGIRLLRCLCLLDWTPTFFLHAKNHFYKYALQLDTFNFLLQSTLHHANKPRNTVLHCTDTDLATGIQKWPNHLQLIVQILQPYIYSEGL